MTNKFRQAAERKRERDEPDDDEVSFTNRHGIEIKLGHWYRSNTTGGACLILSIRGSTVDRYTPSSPDDRREEHYNDSTRSIMYGDGGSYTEELDITFSDE